MEKTKVTLGMMNLALVAIEHGYKQCERGNNLEAALLSAYDLFEIEKPQPSDDLAVIRSRIVHHQ